LGRQGAGGPYSPLESAYSWRIMQEVACYGKTKGGWIGRMQMLSKPHVWRIKAIICDCTRLVLVLICPTFCSARFRGAANQNSSNSYSFISWDPINDFFLASSVHLIQQNQQQITTSRTLHNEEFQSKN
jgi:hypothetical protein